jgi:hypothetical protein
LNGMPSTRKVVPVCSIPARPCSALIITELPLPAE